MPGVPLDGAKIVRTGTLELEVTDLAAALVKAHDAIVGLGGYVGQSTETNDADRSSATVSYRIPADRWDDARNEVRALAAKVVSERTDAVEVTGQLVDLAARIDNLRASEKALQGILERATKVQDILDVESRLSDVRGQIEQLDAQRSHLAEQTTLATLTVIYRLPIVAVQEAQKDWSVGNEVDHAVAALLGVLQAIAAGAIWFAIVWLPLLAFLAFGGAAAVVLARRLGLAGPGVAGPGAGGPGVAGGEPA